VGVELDYYAALDVRRGASVDEITEAVRKAMRLWRKRTEAHDLSIRQEAELRVKRIEEARALLTDPVARQRYDTQLERDGVERAQAAQDPAAGGNWLEKAQHFLAIGDYHSAAYAAREATQSAGNSAQSWWIRSRANLGQSRSDDALYEAQQAVVIEPTNPEYHFHLGAVAESMSRWPQALSEYKEAAQIDPAIPMYQLAIGAVYLQNDLPADALAVIEAVHKAHPDDETACYYLAMALVEMAEHVPARRDAEGYVVTSAEEVARMRSFISRASAVRHLPADARESIQHVAAYLDRIGVSRFHVPFGEARYFGGFRSAVLAMVGFGTALVVLITGLGIVAQGDAGGLLAAAVGLLGGYGWFKLTWVPQWKIAKRLHG
jgi:tetratricopeptide (TPR) repeat protein